MSRLLLNIFILLGATACFGQQRLFNPGVSLLGSYTATRNNFTVRSGPFDVYDRPLNFGFEFNNRFPLGPDNFIRASLRYHQYKSIVTGKNQLSNLRDYPEPFTWERRYESILFAASLGRHIKIGYRIGMDVHLGGSGGLMMTSYAKAKVSLALTEDYNNADFVILHTRDTLNQTPSYWMSTLDVGTDFYLFKRVPQLSIGLAGSIQLNKLPNIRYWALAVNVPRKEEFVYEIIRRPQVANASLAIRYKFGRKATRSGRRAKADCPNSHT